MTKYTKTRIRNLSQQESQIITRDNTIEGELKTFDRFLDLYPTGIVSLVADSYDYWHLLTVSIPKLKDKIIKRNGKTVLRPDSGDPVKIICGDTYAPFGSPEQKGSVQILWETFGGTQTESGLRVLDSHIGLIYGDAITYDRAEQITRELINNGYASTNVVFGVGSFTYSYVTRDTFGFAFKTTAAIVNGKERMVFKDPKTDSGTKKSLKGYISVVKNDDGKLIAVDQLSREESKQGLLQSVWKDGKLLKDYTFEEVKKNLGA